MQKTNSERFTSIKKQKIPANITKINKFSSSGIGNFQPNGNYSQYGVNQSGNLPPFSPTATACKSVANGIFKGRTSMNGQNQNQYSEIAPTEIMEQNNDNEYEMNLNNQD